MNVVGARWQGHLCPKGNEGAIVMKATLSPDHLLSLISFFALKEYSIFSQPDVYVPHLLPLFNFSQTKMSMFL